ncbi:MAG: TrkA family potassium uptake protein [Planctomycetes bacterium]|nr:TrkA family potassium uptake protein [Planctomycetota bacterium]MBL7008315.1 TrkA family potassium uptake protein [Planctomycetota bacterium]
MKKILVLGLGRFGHRLVERLAERDGVRLFALDRNARLVDSVGELVHTAASSNLGDPRALGAFLEQIGGVDVAVVGLGDAAHVTTMTALRLREAGVPQIVIKAEDLEHKLVLEAIDKGFPGAAAFDVVIPELDAAEALALRIASRHIEKELSLGDGIRIAELRCPDRLTEASLAELEVRKRYRLTVLAWHAVGAPLELAGPETVLPEGCLITVLGAEEDVIALEREIERR